MKILNEMHVVMEEKKNKCAEPVAGYWIESEAKRHADTNNQFARHFEENVSYYVQTIHIYDNERMKQMGKVGKA